MPISHRKFLIPLLQYWRRGMKLDTGPFGVLGHRLFAAVIIRISFANISLLNYLLLGIPTDLLISHGFGKFFLEIGEPKLRKCVFALMILLLYSMIMMYMYIQIFTLIDHDLQLINSKNLFPFIIFIVCGEENKQTTKIKKVIAK